MTADQLRRLVKLRRQLNDIRGNEEEVKRLKAEVDSLIHEGVSEAKMKIDALASFGEEDNLQEKVEGMF